MSGLFKTPAMPKVEDPTPLPDANDPRLKRTKRKAMAQDSQTDGVESTILGGGGRETLGA